MGKYTKNQSFKEMSMLLLLLLLFCFFVYLFFFFSHHLFFSLNTAVGLAQSVERLTVEREFSGSFPGTGPTLRVSKITQRNEGTAFALQTGRPSRPV